MPDTRLPRRSTRSSLAVLSLVAVLLSACGSVTPTSSSGASGASGALVASPDASAATPSAEPTPTPTPSPSLGPSPAPSPTPARADQLLGNDGRFTILLLGSDFRPASPGNRTDAIMVVSLDPATGQVGVFSVPRDTTGFPLPEGGTYAPKVNGLYQDYQARNGHGLASMENAISKAFGIEVDYGVLTGFQGVRQLIGAVGGVTVTLAKAYYDPIYWVSSRHQGWGLSAGTHQLDGPNALIFARSRKGDNDFNRARRQQQLVAAAVKKVLAQGSDILPVLVSLAQGTTVTDLPLLRVLDLFALVKTAKLDTVHGEVFGPRAFANDAGGTNFTLNIKACRAWVTKYFPPAKPGATWQPQG